MHEVPQKTSFPAALRSSTVVDRLHYSSSTISLAAKKKVAVFQ